MRIGITFNLKSDLPKSGHMPVPEDAAEEFDSPETIEAIEHVFTEAGHEVHLLGGDLSVADQIKRFQIDFVFNIAEGFQGRSRESHIPVLLEILGVPYSGSDPLGLAGTLDKSLAKRVALSLGIATPEFWILDRLSERSKIPNRFPLFVKPLWEGSSKGIRLTSQVKSHNELEQEVKRLLKDYPETPVLVEEFVAGREFTVAVIGNSMPSVLGVMEIKFRNPKEKNFCYSLEVKRNWKKLVDYDVPPALDGLKVGELERNATELFKALRLRDVARFDFRMDSGGKIYFLEVNPLPGLAPESGDIVIMSKKLGLSYSDLILKIFTSALGRYPALSRAK